MSESCNLKIIDFNYAFQDNVAVSATSESPDFPVSNLKNQFRGRLWKSNGHFEITTSNNKIDFKESSGGGELTATLTPGDFTTATLRAEIKAKMELVGGETYTVTYDVKSGQWTIVTGGSFLSLLFATGTNTAVSTGPEIGFLTGDRTGFTTYTGAVAIHSFEAVLFDLGSAENINSFFIFFSPRRGIRFSDEAEIRLQANPTQDFSSPAVDVLLDIDEEFRTISHFFTTDQEFRYWRVKIIDKQNASQTDVLSVELGLVFFGKSIELSRNVSRGFVYKLRDTSVVRKNLFGNAYSDKRTKIQRLELSYNLMDDTDLRTFKKIYDRVGKTDSIVVAFDSQEVVFDKDLFLIYGKFTTQLAATNVNRNLFDMPANIEETF